MADKFGNAYLTYEAFVKDEIRRKEFLDSQAHKNYVYYKGDHLGILYYLEQHLGRIITDKTVLNKMPKVYVNDVRRVVKRLCLAYSEAPEREYSSLSEEQQAILEMVYPEYKEFHRQAKLLNTIVVRPIWSDKHKRFRFMVLGRHYATAITNQNDQFDLEELYYPRMVQKGDKQEIVYFHWTDEDVWLTDEDGNEINPMSVNIELPEDGNPYGRIPFVTLRLETCEDFWGDGLSDYVNLVEINNGRLCDATYKQWLSFGYPIGTNLGIKAHDFEISPYNPVMVDNVRTDMVTPDLRFVTPDHAIEEDKSLIDWTRKAGGTSKGMSAATFQDEEKDLSGYAKQIDNLELMENNAEDIEALRGFEYDLLEMMKLELNVRGGPSMDSVNLTSIKFNEYGFPKTTDEINAEREFEYRYNLSTPVDWMKQNRPDLSDEEIKELLKENRALKVELGDGRPTLLEKLRSGDNLGNAQRDVLR